MSTVDEQGHESLERLANSTRYAGRPVQACPHSTPRSQLPLGPEEELVKIIKPSTKVLQVKLLKLLEQRPIWTKCALGNQLTVEEFRVINKWDLLTFLSFFLFDRMLLMTFDIDGMIVENKRLPSFLIPSLMDRLEN